jgi:hypothetical protein
MGNHYHLFIETPEANLVEGMKWFQNTYTRRFNVRHRAWGRVFGDRYKSVVVEGRQSGLVSLPDEVDARMSHLRHGWYWGRQELAEKVRTIIGRS